MSASSWGRVNPPSTIPSESAGRIQNSGIGRGGEVKSDGTCEAGDLLERAYDGGVASANLKIQEGLIGFD